MYVYPRESVLQSSELVAVYQCCRNGCKWRILYLLIVLSRSKRESTDVVTGCKVTSNTPMPLTVFTVGSSLPGNITDETIFF